MVKNPRKFVKRKQDEQTAEEMIHGILNGNRTILSKVITLIESSASRHQEQAQGILQELLPHSGKSVRIGITGVPGAGKSTFIEAFGRLLCDQGHRVAVMAVDPSSTVNGGSILGDKTRMEQLSRHPNAFIRPSPSGGTLGGVHRKTRESIIACEAAGFDVIIVETVGVGQSETIVRGMVDFFLLLALTGAGDELQGMKKGIMELVDAVVVNKADGDNIKSARKTMREFKQILHFLTPATSGWEPMALTCSAVTGDGIEEIWHMIDEFAKKTKSTNVFDQRRKTQVKEWLLSMIRDRLETSFYQDENIKELQPSIEAEVMNGTVFVQKAVDQLFSVFQSQQKKGQPQSCCPKNI
ncbi:methylmalonyl Co-A mutase-associated GTPase MeaB [Lederbergia citrea]|uniref:Methylmalonyl Co-A mutase-associated GTPase MeaB n=1 Tax=Lederbergia citrea TaxID=2833581 RepID=A0A942Z2C0_9BACI|nr:methylmalonyl Co-A mutase-associated GTPase MeaB [Lederbergia citrea]MBS4202970.1 methylmalonyl Co-A mutase-associated GTPase MeaB [Lederbergia citrea]MBS4222358.1 methylmalonyl Co-A mutase-associated GTPase MeaB [Lederbergia citrea]